MSNSRADGPAGLSAVLHPIDTPPDDLPVGGFRPDAEDWVPRLAGVLVPVLSAPEPQVLLTVRSPRLAQHAGQVAFPGGGAHASDRGLVETALREAHEEAGILPEQVRPLGFLDRYDTITGYRMVPVVGLVEGRVDLRACPREVDCLFTVPLSVVLDSSNYNHTRVTLKGQSHVMVTLAHPQHFIWGATAALLEQLCTRWHQHRV